LADLAATQRTQITPPAALPDLFENAPEIGSWGEAHSSISVQEPQPFDIAEKFFNQG
jgi:hypothetical protein